MGKIQESLQRIFETKKKRGEINQAVLAEKVGISQAQVSRILSGQSGLTEDTILKLCDAMGVTLSDLDVPEDISEAALSLKLKVAELMNEENEEYLVHVSNALDHIVKLLEEVKAKT